MSAVETEHVLVVPTEVFHSIGHFQGFTPDVARYLDVLLQQQHVSYRPRDAMEQDPSFKQLIPYVVFRHQQAGRTHLFQYRRGSGQGESRLHARRSIGVGGHISSVDAQTGADPYGEGLRRELEEEVHVGSPFQAACVGMINDDQSDVGRVHLGVVHVYDLQQPQVTPREDEMHDAGFLPVQELLQDQSQFETWSQITLQALFGG